MNLRFLISTICFSPSVFSFSFFPQTNGIFSPKAMTKATSTTSPVFQTRLFSEKEEQKKSVIPKPEKGSEEELMYTLGINLARQLGDIRPLVENGIELTQVAKGLLDAVVGRLNEEEQVALLNERGQELNELITARADKIREGVSQAGDDMLENMSQTEGVETLPSGVRVHILDKPTGAGEGLSPTVASSIKVHYHGTLPDGTTFDSTQGGEPVKFALSQVIPGWREALLTMHEGETAMIGIPSAQAYGKDGSGDGSVPGGCAIFFKVQLIEVLSAGIGGGPSLLGADGMTITKGDSGLLGIDGKPM